MRTAASSIPMISTPGSAPAPALVAFTHCSNVVASINPVRELTDRIHAAGAIAIVDGVSYCPHGLPDIPALGADIYLCPRSTRSMVRILA